MPVKKIFLTIDDDADDRFFFKRAVKKMDDQYECLEAADGHDAIEQLKNTTELPHYIFLDLNMPRMNGMECLATLKKEERLKDIPVIIYSTSTHSRDMELSSQLGAIYYLSKPVNVQQLPELLSKTIATVEAKLAS